MKSLPAAPLTGEVLAQMADQARASLGSITPDANNLATALGQPPLLDTAQESPASQPLGRHAGQPEVVIVPGNVAPPTRRNQVDPAVLALKQSSVARTLTAAAEAHQQGQLRRRPKRDKLR